MVQKMTEIRNLITAACRERGITQGELSWYIWGSETALYRRLKDPGTFRVQELALLWKKLNMNEETRTKMIETIYRKETW